MMSTPRVPDVPFRAGLEATALIGPRAGVGNYLARLGRAMLRTAEPDWEVIFYAQRPLQVEAELQRTLVGTGYWKPSRWLWVQLRIAALARRDGCNVLHCPNGMGPLSTSIPLVLTIHDLSLFRYPDSHPRARLLFTRRLLPRLARRAAAIVAISDFTRREIVSILQVPPEKVRTIHSAAGERFQPETNADRLAWIRNRWCLPERFALFVGTLEPRKNLHRLLRAFREVRRSGLPHHLVLAGRRGWRMGGFEREMQRLGLTDCVHHLGYVPDAHLPALYSLAELVVFPSLYEGFGLPVVEAMACGTPVLSSKTSALAEVCSEAAYLIDPESTEALAQGMSTLLTDRDWLAELRRRGFARAGEFSWERAANETMALYREVARRGTAGSR